MEDKRLIEVDFPLKEVSAESVREKNLRHGHISTFHVWWARKPLAASRATIFAALVGAPKDDTELGKKLEFIVKLSKYESYLNQSLVEEARKTITDNFGGRFPRVLDCFAGGGSIPLEASRLGCETYALELNPVAVLMLKAILEYPQKFGANMTGQEGSLRAFAPSHLSEDIKKWGNWVEEQARAEIAKFYGNNENELIPICYLWARTIKCNNPSCRAEIPLMSHFWLAEKSNQKMALRMVVNKENKQIDFEIVSGKSIDFDASQGTTEKGTVLCPVCKAGIDSSFVRKEAVEGRMRSRIVAVVLTKQRGKGKVFRKATKEDFSLFKKADEYLAEKTSNWSGDFKAVPDEYISTPDRDKTVSPKELPAFFVHLQPVNYGMSRWGDLFNSRQKLALITFVEKIRLAFEEMIKRGYSREYAKAVITYLSIALDRLVDKNSSLCIWNKQRVLVEHTFLRASLPMIVWQYAEINAFAGQGWNMQLSHVLESMNLFMTNSSSPTAVDQGTATRLPYSNEFFDAVITDPAYYDNVPYSDLADFFYVWLKRTLVEQYPDLFSTPLSPKAAEIIQSDSYIRRGSNIRELDRDAIKDKSVFERELTYAIKEISRVLKPDGIALISFTHRSTEAWETVINSLLRSGLVLTASWPINTEKAGRPRAQKSAALASSIYMVCRKRAREDVAYFSEIKSEIEKKISRKLTQFWDQGITGADFFVSAIGPAIEIFGKYSKVEKLSGEEVSIQELLEYVRKIVSEFALKRVLKRADLGGVDTETRFYLLWRWLFGNTKVPFDDAIKLSRPMGVELTQIWDGGGFVKKEKEFVRVLDPKERAKDPVFLRKTKFTSMIDVLHYVVVLWERGEKERIKEILNETGYAGNEIFWQTAQAISEILPPGDKEKQLLQGFLYGKEAYIKEAARGKKTMLDFTESG